MQEKVGEAKGAEVGVWGTFRGNEWDNKGEVVGVTLDEGVFWFEVKALGPKEYLLARPGCEYSTFQTVVLWIRRKMRCLRDVEELFADIVLLVVSPLSILKNPMILIAVLSLGLVFGLPYLMENSKLPD